MAYNDPDGHNNSKPLQSSKMMSVVRNIVMLAPLLFLRHGCLAQEGRFNTRTDALGSIFELSSPTGSVETTTARANDSLSWTSTEPAPNSSSTTDLWPTMMTTACLGDQPQATAVIELTFGNFVGSTTLLLTGVTPPDHSHCPNHTHSQVESTLVPPFPMNTSVGAGGNTIRSVTNGPPSLESIFKNKAYQGNSDSLRFVSAVLAPLTLVAFL